ncbi:hypothetical protein PMKS-002254 [Pichia membranifaciens]|uniref:Thiamine-binding protein domain-containing protein n=1 Tax=Pichia membranifaciens TaxID=4926 RepID=A0A1Q2YGV7_9ASCO|nr:hypothetical protein PMKS-002254 [Pichia membranifaciens]
MTVKLKCIADICLIPIGTPTPSVSKYVVACEKLIRNSGLTSKLHSAGTTIEGPWSEVMDLIGKLHEEVHKMDILRVQSDIRVGTRTDKSQTMEDKVNSVETQLSKN